MCGAIRNSKPKNLRVALTGANAVLRWEAPDDTDSLTGYRILRGVDAETPTVHVADTGTTDTTWTDDSPAPGDYVWVVKALFEDYYPSRESNRARKTVPSFPGTVRNLSPVAEPGKVTLSWDALEGDAPVTGYRIRRGEAAGSLEVIAADTSNTSTTYVDTTVAAGKSYFYSVAALNGEAGGPTSEPVRVGSAASEVVSSGSFEVVEGETAVTALSARDDDTPLADLAWSIHGGADRSSFALSASGALTFVAAKNYGAPDDANGDGTYDLTVQVTDGETPVTADLEVRLANRNEAPEADAGPDQSEVEEGATVTLTGSGRDPDAGDNLQYAWTQTGGVTVTLSASAPSAAAATFAAPTGLTEDAVLTFTLRVTVVAAEAPQGPPLTANFHAMPASHDGTNPFTFELRFSEELGVSYLTLRDSAFTVTNGRVTGARHLNRPSNLRWEITVEPTSAGDITIVLPGGRACNAAGAVCTAAAKRLSNSPSATVR